MIDFMEGVFIEEIIRERDEYSLERGSGVERRRAVLEWLKATDELH